MAISFEYGNEPTDSVKGVAIFEVIATVLMKIEVFWDVMRGEFVPVHDLKAYRPSRVTGLLSQPMHQVEASGHFMHRPHYRREITPALIK